MAKDILNMKSACAYIRVSTDKQEELSPDAQKRLLIDFAKRIICHFWQVISILIMVFPARKLIKDQNL